MRRSELERSSLREGFTLIELLVAITIFSVVAVALYSTMSTGINAWRKGEDSGNLYQEAMLAVGTMAKELRNINTTFGEGIEIPFQGEADRLSFPALVNTASPGGPIQLELGKVTYYLDREQSSLMRRQETYIQSLKETEQPSEEFASSVTALGFEYYYEKVENGKVGSEWRSSWETEKDGPAIPRGVRISLILAGGRGPELVNFGRSVWIAMGEPGKLEE